MPQQSNTFAVKIEHDKKSAVSTTEGWNCGNASDPSSSHRHPTVGQAITVVVKQEPDESAFLRIHESSCSGAFDCTSSMPVDVEEPWKDGRLHVVEDLVDSEWESSDSLESSGSSSQDQLDQGWQDKQEKPRHNSHFGAVSENNVAMFQSTDIHESEHIYSQTTAGEPSFRCFVCKKTFACWSDLCGHAVVHRVKKPVRPTCLKALHMRSQLTALKGVHTDERSNKCPLCHKAFRRQLSLDIHKRKIHSDEMPFKCTTCFNAFQWKHELADHEKFHRSLRPYKCPSCPEAFRADHLLVAHNQRIHPGEKLFKCSTCPRAFRWNYQLTRHEILHTDERPFKCPSCSRTFKVECRLIAHGRLHTDKGPFKCSACSKAFVWKHELTAHKKLNKCDKPFKCQTCNKAFWWKSSLTKHERTHMGKKPS